jgi:hypothetical protein
MRFVYILTNIISLLYTSVTSIVMDGMMIINGRSMGIDRFDRLIQLY